MKALAPFRIWLPVIILVVIGLLSVASAGEAGRFARQLLWVAAGGIIAGIIIVLGVDNVLQRAYLLYAVGLIALGLVLFSPPVNGVRAWFDFGLFKVQPSELFRPVLLLVLARFLGAREESGFVLGSYPWRRQVFKYATVAWITFIPLLLVQLEPDIGVALAFLWLAAVVVLASDISWQLIGLGSAGAVFSGLAVYHWGLSVSQRARITAWLNPAAHGHGAAWQMLRSKLAIGSGGFWGKGWGLGEMNRLGLVPVNDSDFIFSVVVEELGFVAALLLIACYVWILWECVLLARRVPDPACRLLVMGTGGYLAGQAALNICVAIGSLPTTGVTLPFVSYGGSSLISNVAMVAMAVSVAINAHGRKLAAA
ncbi:MAG: FtsW/RodA/SpoVE family cell cycle protein [Planctomycetes bacterium]|nr:FtsW/RodA/SpoVE family cell cycle protein [Planctomycetota bacterium]